MKRSIIPSIRWIGPIPWPEKQPQTKMFPPPYLVVPIQYFGFSRCCFGLLTRLIPSECFKLYLDSSENNTVFHFWTVQLICNFANSSLAFLFLAEINGFLAGRRLKSPASTARLLIVLELTGKLKSIFICSEETVGSLWIFLLIVESSCRVVFRGLPPLWIAEIE